MRKLAVNGVEYQYKVGRKNLLIIWGMDKKVIPFSLLLGITNDEVITLKKQNQFSVTPKLIANFINNGFRSIGPYYIHSKCQICEQEKDNVLLTVSEYILACNSKIVRKFMCSECRYNDWMES